MTDTVTLIVATPSAAGGNHDRGGGEAQGVVDWIRQRSAEVNFDKFSENLSETVNRVKVAIDRVHADLGGYIAHEIKLGLSVSAEGNVGIATAGVESTIEVTFKRRE